MKLSDVYTPVFTTHIKKSRQLRADFGSRKVDLMCVSCLHEFTKRIGPNTSSVNCPVCNANRVRPGLNELAKKKILKMKGYVEDSNFTSAIKESIEIIACLHGRTDKKSITLMNESINVLVSIETGLLSRKDEIIDYINNGTGHDELSVIAEALGYTLFSNE